MESPRLPKRIGPQSAVGPQRTTETVLVPELEANTPESDGSQIPSPMGPVPRVSVVAPVFEEGMSVATDLAVEEELRKVVSPPTMISPRAES
jgi:hypothetical protein